MKSQVSSEPTRFGWIGAPAALAANGDVAARGVAAPEKEAGRAPGQVREACYVARGTDNVDFLLKNRDSDAARMWHVAVWTGAPENAVLGAGQVGLALLLCGTQHGQSRFFTKKPRFTTQRVCGTWHVAVWIFAAKTRVAACQDAVVGSR